MAMDAKLSQKLKALGPRPKGTLPRKRPDNSFSLGEFRAEFGLGGTAARLRIRQLIADKKLRRVEYMQEGVGKFTVYLLIEDDESPTAPVNTSRSGKESASHSGGNSD